MNDGSYQPDGLTEGQSCKECQQGFLKKVAEKIIGRKPEDARTTGAARDYGRPPSSPVGIITGKTSEQIDFMKVCDETEPLAPSDQDYHDAELSARLKAARAKTDACFNTAVRKYIEESIVQIEAASSRGWHHAVVQLQHADKNIKSAVVSYLETNGYKVDAAAPQYLTVYW